MPLGAIIDRPLTHPFSGSETWCRKNATPKMHVCGTLKPVRKLYGISFKTRFKHVDISVSIYRVNWSMALYAKEIELTGNADRSIPLV